jgi:hypothetical protein
VPVRIPENIVLLPVDGLGRLSVGPKFVFSWDGPKRYLLIWYLILFGSEKRIPLKSTFGKAAKDLPRAIAPGLKGLDIPHAVWPWWLSVKGKKKQKEG